MRYHNDDRSAMPRAKDGMCQCALALLVEVRVRLIQNDEKGIPV